jgi:hypothetical protein
VATVQEFPQARKAAFPERRSCSQVPVLGALECEPDRIA